MEILNQFLTLALIWQLTIQYVTMIIINLKLKLNNKNNNDKKN